MKGSFAMGINISHGANRYGQIYRSASAVAALGHQLAYVLKPSDWRTVQHLFGGKRKSDDTLISPKQARQIAAALRKAAGHPKMSADGALDAAEFATAAALAADLGEPWSWS
ncbi:hypothetical protein AB0F20_05690 [Streptomyces goshikiensis]|uniref:DUF7739 domain-containing protein n=1 Tax=Streptomyces goshikiensis TaxID=1942 RepID=UPI0033DF9C69